MDKDLEVIQALSLLSYYFSFVKAVVQEDDGEGEGEGEDGDEEDEDDVGMVGGLNNYVIVMPELLLDEDDDCACACVRRLLSFTAYPCPLL